jgi:hypothetical protein
LHTGGSATGLTSTRSSRCPRARSKASDVGISPRAVRSAPMTDTLGAAISPFMRTLIPRTIPVALIIAHGLCRTITVRLLNGARTRGRGRAKT